MKFQGKPIIRLTENNINKVPLQKTNTEGEGLQTASGVGSPSVVKKNSSTLPNPIKSYIVHNDEDNFETLFEATQNNIDLKTELEFPEIAIINVLEYNDKFLNEHGIDSIYSKIVDCYLRLKVSKDRKSRVEFVDINRRDNLEQNLSKINDYQGILKTKE